MVISFDKTPPLEAPPNASEDLAMNNSADDVWVQTTHDDVITFYGIGAPLPEGAQVSTPQATEEGPM